MYEQVSIAERAERIVNYNAKRGRKDAGNYLIGKPSAYGYVLKYIFGLRDLSYQSVSELFGLTPQAINYIINRAGEDYFNEFVIARMCKRLNIDTKYFNELVDEVRKII